jgi:hypothetical protein
LICLCHRPCRVWPRARRPAVQDANRPRAGEPLRAALTAKPVARPRPSLRPRRRRPSLLPRLRRPSRPPRRSRQADRQG